MKSGWIEKPLGEACDVLDRLRKPITKRDRVAGPYPYYGATGVLDHVAGYLFDEPLVLVGEDGAKWEAGEDSAFAIDGKTWVNNHAHVIRPNRDIIIDDWLIYYLNCADLMPYISGMTVPKLNQGRLVEIPIPLPPLEEQQRIVAILDEAFEGLARARANAEANLRDARELFENWSASVFEMVSHNATVNTAQVSQVALPERGSIRTGPFGSQLLHSEFVEEGVAVLGIDNAVANKFRWGKRRFITEEKYEQLRRYTVRPGDVIVTIMGTCGRCAVIPDEIPIAINTKHLCCISLDLEKCLPEYLYRYFLFSPRARCYLASRTLGSIMSGLNMGIIREMPIEYPSIKDQRKIVDLIGAAENQTQELVVRYETDARDIANLRQSLLRKAFAGELT
ncbi:MAG: restriction endonuclease subunit S [Alphaproteobacteria bacterium]